MAVPAGSPADPAPGPAARPAGYVRVAGDEVRIWVRVQPGASRTELAPARGGELTLRVAAPPVEGRANDAARRFLAELLGVAPSAVRLVQGATSRRKCFAVRGISPAQVQARLAGHLPR